MLSTDFEDDGEDESDSGWQQELQRRYAQEANFMAELRARHPSSPENSQGNAPNYSQNLVHNYNQPGQNFHIQGIHYPQNHNVNVGSNYGPQQVFPNFGPVRNPGPFGNPVRIFFFLVCLTPTVRWRLTRLLGIVLRSCLLPDVSHP